jgi:hypothetical protein
MGRLKGKKNGELLRAAEAAGYQVLLTVDQGIPHQQHFVDRVLSIVLIYCPTNQIEDLLPMVEAIAGCAENNSARRDRLDSALTHTSRRNFAGAVSDGGRAAGRDRPGVCKETEKTPRRPAAVAILADLSAVSTPGRTNDIIVLSIRCPVSNR